MKMWEEYIKKIMRLRRMDVDKVRKFLERNKIFFEITSSILLTVMSLILAFVGVKTEIRDSKTNEKLLAIEESDRKPYFLLECEPIWKKTKETKGTNQIVDANIQYLTKEESIKC